MTKKEKIEHIARELFFRHGFKRVTVDEICKKSHVSRKTYYTFYENKNALVLFILKEMTEQSFHQYQQLIDGPGSFSDKLLKALQLKNDFSKSISMEFVTDFMDPGSADLLAFWQEMMQKNMHLMMKFLTDAQQKGEMNPHLKISYVMWLMQHMSDLMKSKELMMMFENAGDMVVQLSESLMYGLMPVPVNSTSDITKFQ